MADKIPQTYANHVRFDPPYHFFVMPVFGLTVLAAIWNLARHPSFRTAWLVLYAVAAAVALFKIRLYSLKAQDRVIRLEELLRLSALLSEPLKSRIPELSEAQLIALRFACDAEIPGLVEKTLANRWTNAEIKKAVVNWRPDYFRV